MSLYKLNHRTCLHTSILFHNCCVFTGWSSSAQKEIIGLSSINSCIRCKLLSEQFPISWSRFRDHLISKSSVLPPLSRYGFPSIPATVSRPAFRSATPTYHKRNNRIEHLPHRLRSVCKLYFNLFFQCGSCYENYPANRTIFLLSESLMCYRSQSAETGSGNAMSDRFWTVHRKHLLSAWTSILKETGSARDLPIPSMNFNSCSDRFFIRIPSVSTATIFCRFKLISLSDLRL